MINLPPFAENDFQESETSLIPEDITNMQILPYPYTGNKLSRQQKINIISNHFKQILLTIGMNLEDDSIAQTPLRYAKMIVNELFGGLDGENFPKITAQKNVFG